MRRITPIILAAAVIALGASTAFLYSRYQKSELTNANLQSDKENAQNQYAQTINAIAEIQDSLNAISVGENNMTLETQSMQSERRLEGPNGPQVLERIALLRASIMRSRERINQLESQLHKGGMRISGLERMVASLKQSTAEKEAQIATLQGQVGQLQTQVTGLTTQVAEVQDTVRSRDESLAERQQELATVYYVADTKSALAKSGVIIAKGGVLGLGKTITPSTHAPDGMFKTLNTDEETTLDLPTAKARVITAQPASSYEMRLVNGRMQLHILDPTEFRRIRQLVIVTA